MSENNINNFKTLIEQKRIIKKAIAKSLLAFGAPDNKSVSQYRPVGILWEDLLEQIKSEVGAGTLQDLESVLGVGNTTGTNDILVNALQSIYFGGSTTDYITRAAGASANFEFFAIRAINFYIGTNGSFSHNATGIFQATNLPTSRNISLVPETGQIAASNGLGQQGNFNLGPMTANPTWTMPDATGTVALTNNLQTEMSYASSDATTPLVVDTNIGGMFATHDMAVDSVFAGVSVVGTGPGITTIMLQKNGINMLTLPITIDSTEATSLTAATQPILPYTVIAKGDRISTNITTVTGNAAAGLQVTLNGLRT